MTDCFGRNISLWTEPVACLVPTEHKSLIQGYFRTRRYRLQAWMFRIYLYFWQFYLSPIAHTTTEKTALLLWGAKMWSGPCCCGSCYSADAKHICWHYSFVRIGHLIHTQSITFQLPLHGCEDQNRALFCGDFPQRPLLNTDNLST